MSSAGASDTVPSWMCARRAAQGVLVVTAAAAFLAGCSTTSASSGQPTRSGPGAGVTCPATVPNGDGPPGERPGPTHHGNGALWTVLPEDGVVRAKAGGSTVKVPWWAASAEGDLVVEGRRLDGPAPPLGSRINRGWPDSGFTGGSFWSSMLTFETDGCWEVAGRAGQASLTFVLHVVS
jgi:hypothetical protein